MPQVAVTVQPQQNLVNAGKLNKKQRDAVLDIVGRITAMNEVQVRQLTGVRGKPGDAFRIDVRYLEQGANGAQAGDYKLEVQNNGKNSVTFGIVFVANQATNASLGDLADAIDATLRTQQFYRVT